MKPPRRIFLQLTPLLDLMMIIMFAQAIQMNQTAGREISHANRTAEREIALAAQARDEARALSEHAQRLADALEVRLEAQARSNERLIQENERLRDELELARLEKQEVESQIRGQIGRVGALASQMLGISEQSLDSMLEMIDLEDAKSLRNEFEELQAKSAAEIIRHLRKMDVLQKKCDIWEAHIAGDNTLRFTVRGEIAAENLFVASAADIQAKLMELLPLEEPKSLVLVIFSYAGEAARKTRRDAQAGLQSLCNTLYNAYDRRKRFEFAPINLVVETP
ncbi:MAG: hypothetical protein BWZ10_02010 [candidate division BRC1 bacterium ADurb.BinA364]|nr:MAG: hypothetical protein BWZ10_02010 [candidate division BRC1 bacterium ADurb.BinA364]